MKPGSCCGFSSSGFHPSVAAWWASRPVQSPGEPVSMPVLAPTGPVAQAIVEAMQKALQLQERVLRKERRCQAASRRESDPNLLFRDLRPARSSPVETLNESPQAKVCEVRREEGCVVVESPTQWLQEVPFVCNHCPVDVHHAEPDCLYGDVLHLCPGDTISQRVHLAALPDLFKAFSDEWSKRWVKVDHFRADRWAQAVETFPALPACQMAYAPIAVDASRRGEGLMALLARAVRLVAPSASGRPLFAIVPGAAFAPDSACFTSARSRRQNFVEASQGGKPQLCGGGSSKPERSGYRQAIQYSSPDACVCVGSQGRPSRPYLARVDGRRGCYDAPLSSSRLLVACVGFPRRVRHECAGHGTGRPRSASLGPASSAAGHYRSFVDDWQSLEGR